MITAIVIPADEEKPAYTKQFDEYGLLAYQALVGGRIEAVDMFDPDATVYLNEEGKLLGLPINRRATALTWIHNRWFQGADVLCGDVVVVGRPDERGNDTTVPQELVRLLLETKHWRLTFVVVGGFRVADSQRPPETFDTWSDAYIFGADLTAKFPRLVRDVRVVSADG